MGNKKFDIALNSFLPDLLNGLEDKGISIHKYLKNSFYRKLDLYDPNSYIPIILLEEILIDIKNDVGLSNFSSDFGKHFKSTTMGDFSKHFYQSPNFLTLLDETTKYQRYIRSNYEVKLDINGPVSRYSVKIVEAPSQGKLVCEEIDIMRILDAFKIAFGPKFLPLEIGITGKKTKNLHTILPLGDYKVKLNQDESWVLFNSNLLSKKNEIILPNSSIDNIVKSNNPVSFRIEMMLDSFQTGHIPNMEELAILFEISRRTLERKLLNEGSNFAIIKEKYLLRKSFELLQDSKLSVKEIAEQLNYSNSQNYIRRFKAWTSTTPSKYRLSMSQNDC